MTYLYDTRFFYKVIDVKLKRTGKATLLTRGRLSFSSAGRWIPIFDAAKRLPSLARRNVESKTSIAEQELYVSRHKDVFKISTAQTFTKASKMYHDNEPVIGTRLVSTTGRGAFRLRGLR